MTVRIVLLSLFLIGVLFACKKQLANRSQGKFAARLSDAMWGETNRLINHVHEHVWSIAYGFRNCEGHKLPDEKVFEDAISRVLQLWLDPVKEVAQKHNKSIKIAYNYLKLKKHSDYQVMLKERQALFTENNVKLHIQFNCKPGTSYVSKRKYHLPFMHLYHDKHLLEGVDSTTIKGTHFLFYTLLHEMGHAFGLLDTYPPNSKSQPASIMSVELTKIALGEDDIKGIQWLYLYTYERDSLPPNNPCFFPDYEPSEWENGVCLPKHPLITRLKQAEKHVARKSIMAAISILEKTFTDVTDIDCLMVDMNKVNAQDEDGNTALHLSVKYYLANRKKHSQQSRWQDSPLAVHYAQVAIALLTIQKCPTTKEAGVARQQALKRVYDDCVNQIKDDIRCTCIDLQIKNKEGKTVRDFAVEAKAIEIVQAIDTVLKIH